MPPAYGKSNGIQRWRINQRPQERLGPYKGLSWIHQGNFKWPEWRSTTSITASCSFSNTACSCFWAVLEMLRWFSNRSLVQNSGSDSTPLNTATSKRPHATNGPNAFIEDHKKIMELRRKKRRRKVAFLNKATSHDTEKSSKNSMINLQTKTRANMRQRHLSKMRRVRHRQKNLRTLSMWSLHFRIC